MPNTECWHVYQAFSKLERILLELPWADKYSSSVQFSWHVKRQILSFPLFSEKKEKKSTIVFIYQQAPGKSSWFALTKLLLKNVTNNLLPSLVSIQLQARKLAVSPCASSRQHPSEFALTKRKQFFSETMSCSTNGHDATFVFLMKDKWKDW